MIRMSMAMLIITIRMGVLIVYHNDNETFRSHQGVQQVGYATEGRTARKSPLDKLSSGGGT